MSWFRRTFGPSKKEIWSEVAREIGGDFLHGGFWKKDKVIYCHKNWKIEMDSYTTGGKNSKTYTRLRACFITLDYFEFRMFEENILSPWSKKLGLQDIQVGDVEFDEKYMLKGNNEAQTKALLQPTSIKEIMKSINDIQLSIQNYEGFFLKAYRQNLQLINYRVYGVLKDKKQITNTFTLFCLLLDRLVEIDSASEEDPKFSF